MARSYKQKCSSCKKNYVIVTWKNKYPLCYECVKNEISQEIKDPAMKEMFDIPEELYKTNTFLRDIKVKYIRYGELSEKQIETFKQVAHDLMNEEDDEIDTPSGEKTDTSAK